MTARRKLLTIICESDLEKKLGDDVMGLGAHGYTVTEARGRSAGGERDAAWSPSGNIRMEVICEAAVAELAALQARADELETNRSTDRHVAEQAIEGFRTKTDSASARAVMMEEELAEMRARHTEELERASRELGAARARVEAADGELASRRAREDELHRALTVAEARCLELQRTVGERPIVERPIVDIAEIAAANDPVPDVVSGTDRAVPVGIGGAGHDEDRPRPPSDLRRAVFASLTELAGDG